MNHSAPSPTAIITGASRGIGRATAVLAAQGGFRLCLTYQSDHDAGAQIVRDIEAEGGNAFAVQADVSKEADVLAIFAEVDQRFGQLDALVNNAGILDQQTDLIDMSAARIERILSVNVLGSFLCAREAVKRMAKSHGGDGGCIVNVSSRAALLGSPHEYIDYAASKGAMDSMTIGLSKEVADEGIRVNGVRPGLILTEMHAAGGEPGRVDRLKGSVPLNRGGTAEEVAQAIVWLMSSAASYCTGTFIDVSGGR